MLSNFYEYFFGDDKPIEYKERLKYLTTVSRYELVESSLPVFVAAGVSGSASAIIGVLSEEKEDIELVLKLLYTLFAYFVGKALTYRLLVDEDRNSTTFPFPLLREYKFSKLSRHSLSELSGFAWKEFAIAFCLEEIFLKEGLGAAFGSWLLIVFSAIAFVTVSSHIQRKIFRLDHTWNHKVLSYDTDAFALSIAYVLTAAVALGLWELGVGLAPSSSILFEWDEGFEEDHEGGTDIVYLYAIIIACVVAVMQFSEDEEGGQQSDELCEVSAPVTATPVIRPSTAPSALQQAAAAAETINPIATSNHSSFELDRGSGNSAPTPAHLLSPPGAQAEEGAVWFFVFDHDSVVTLKGVWNEFLG